MPTLRCLSCGAVQSDENVFCPACGGRLGGHVAIPGISSGGTQELWAKPGQGEPGRGAPPAPEGNGARREPPEPKLRSGVADRYHLIRRIGEGGMGAIYLAQERLSGRFVAMKIVSDARKASIPMVQQFVLEAVITARLQHPNIIPVYDLGFFTEGQLYYTMRFVDGRTFSTLLPIWDLPRKLRVLRSVASAVKLAHDQGLWHRDLKPDNVLVGPHGDSYVIDWGLVTPRPGMRYELQIPSLVLEDREVILDDDLFDRTPNAASTQSGAVLGTPAYMAPETLLAQTLDAGGGGPGDASADIWALGVILFECLTGRHPLARYEVEDVREFVSFWATHRDKPPERPSELAPGTPHELDDVCSRMLECSVQKRMSQLDELIAALDRFLGGPSTVAFLAKPDLAPARARTGDGESSVFTPAPALARWRPDDDELRAFLALSAEHADLQARYAVVNAERDRLQRKTELLTDLAQLEPSQEAERRRLTAELLRT